MELAQTNDVVNHQQKIIDDTMKELKESHATLCKLQDDLAYISKTPQPHTLAPALNQQVQMEPTKATAQIAQNIY